MNMRTEDVECDNCGAKYYVANVDASVINGCTVLHRVCDTCFMPMAVRNPFEKEGK